MRQNKVKIFDYEDRAYFLIDDTMIEVEPHAYGIHNKIYYSFNRSEITILPHLEEGFGSFVNVVCYIKNVEDNTIDCDNFKLEIKRGVFKSRLCIGCRIFLGDAMQILLSWLKANEKLKPYLEKREKEIQEYYDRLNKPNS